MTGFAADFQADFAAAAARHDFAEIAALVGRGASPDSRISGVPLLVYAVCQGQVPLMRELLAAGADVEQGDANGNTALNHAARLALTDVVSELIENGADPLKRNAAGRTPREDSALAREAFATSSDHMDPDEIANECARYSRVAAVLQEAETETLNRRAIEIWHKGVERPFTVGKPLRFKPRN